MRYNLNCTESAVNWSCVTQRVDPVLICIISTDGALLGHKLNERNKARKVTIFASRLLNKLKAIGIDDTMLAWVRAWVKDFLSSRRMRVCVRKSASGWVLVVSGVPRAL